MPRFIYVQNIDRKIKQPARAALCDTFAGRLRGLMFRTSLPDDEGVLLAMPRESRIDSSIHMLFVSFNLAVFWITESMQVVDKVIAKPWRPAYMPSRAARYVLELHPRFFAAYEIGDRVEFTDA